MDSNASPWAQLGSLNRIGASAAPPAPADEVDDDPPVRRTVPAAGAPSAVPPGAVASVFSHPYQPSAGSAERLANDTAADHREEKSRMPKNTTAPKERKKRQPTKGTSARFQICALLMAKGDLTRDEILADVDADRNAIYQAFFGAKKAEHIVFIAKTDKWHITAAGKAWTSGGANLDNQQASAPPPKATRRKKAAEDKKPRAKAKRQAKAAPAADTTTYQPLNSPHPIKVRDARPQVVAERSFRCAAYSDGGFMLSKGGQTIELTAQEHAEMIRYEERMAELPA